MNDDHAKQSSDSSSGQNKASEEDLHGATLHTSNPAFRTLAAMGLAGDIKPEKVAVPKAKSSKNITSKAKSSRTDSAKGKGKKQSIPTVEIARPKKSSRLTVEAVQAQKSSAEEELSPFSLWLETLAIPAISEISSSKSEAGSETEESTAKERPEEKAVSREKAAKTTLSKVMMPRTQQDQADTTLKAPAVGEKQKRRKKKKKKKKGSYDTGVVLSDDIFSETLADLLASQGHYRQAIHMYEKMRLIYPEKSRFFAAKIEELNKKE